jgi:hypothetical protein
MNDRRFGIYTRASRGDRLTRRPQPPVPSPPVPPAPPLSVISRYVNRVHQMVTTIPPLTHFLLLETRIRRLELWIVDSSLII